jgi:hypothetical protein
MPFAISLLLAVLASTPAEGTIVGIAEEFPSGSWGSPVVPQVRVGFVRTASGWEVRGEPAPSKTGETGRLRWSVCFDGRTLSSIETEPVQSESYSRQGTHAPVAKQKIPFTGKRTKEFRGWLDEVVHRPLVLSSPGRCTDPDGWHREQAGDELRASLIEHARTTVTLEICDDDPCTQWHPERRDIEVAKLYVAKSGERLAMLRIRPPGIGDEDLSTDTFPVFLARIDAARNISSLGNGVVVDAGDYDGDGRSEVVIKSGDYNQDGYTMFYDGFSKQVSLRWEYH